MAGNNVFFNNNNANNHLGNRQEAADTNMSSSTFMGAVLIGSAIAMSNTVQNGGVDGDLIKNTMLQAVVAGILLGVKDEFKDIAKRENYSENESKTIGRAAFIGGVAAVAMSAKENGFEPSQAIISAIGGSVVGGAAATGGIKLAKKAGSFVGRLSGQNEERDNVGRDL